MNRCRLLALPTLFVVTSLLACDDSPSTGGSPDGTLLDTAGDGLEVAFDVPDAIDEDATEPPDAVGDVAPDGNDASDVGVELTGPILTIVVEGSLDDRSPDDGLAAQTPDPYYYGFQRLELLRSESDPSPEVVFDYAPDYLLVDMHERNEVARVAINQLPTGTFTHVRFVLTTLEADVMATLHEVPVVGTLQTPLHILFALSPVTIDGVSLAQGDARVTLEFAGTEVTTPSHWDVDYPEPGPSGGIETVDSTTYITFRIPEPVTISPGATDDVTTGLRVFITDSFRWQDQDETDYTEGEWDITLGTPPTPEPVSRFGANDIEIFLE